MTSIRELSIDGCLIITGATEYGGIKFGETWGGRGGIGAIIEGGIPPFIATDTVEFGGGSEDGGRKQAPWHGPCHIERVWPSGGGGRNIDPGPDPKRGEGYGD